MVKNGYFSTRFRKGELMRHKWYIELKNLLYSKILKIRKLSAIFRAETRKIKPKS